MIRFRLYVAGETIRAQRAIENLHRMGREMLAGEYELVVVDVMAEAESAERDRILTTPTVIKEAPLPARRVTGDLSDLPQVMFALGLETSIKGRELT